LKIIDFLYIALKIRCAGPELCLALG
jgi:hypothetical protein